LLWTCGGQVRTLKGIRLPLSKPPVYKAFFDGFGVVKVRTQKAVSGRRGTGPAADARASILPPPCPRRCSPATTPLPVARRARAGEHLHHPPPLPRDGPGEPCPLLSEAPCDFRQPGGTASDAETLSPRRRGEADAVDQSRNLVHRTVQPSGRTP